MLWQKITIHFLIVLPLLVIASCKSGSPPTQNTPVYQLTINVEPAEAGTVSPEAGEFDAGDVVEITASQNEEWIFDSWQGDHSGSANPDSVIMNSDKEITALFVLREYPLTVEIEGEGVVDERVVQGSSGENATVIELTAKPADGWRFVHWEGDIEGNTNPATIVVDSEKNITAVFERREYPLTINIEGKGTVTEEILHSMATDYPFETVVQLTATAAQGWVFSHWEGDVTGSENPEQIEITDDKEVTAVFEKDFFELNIEIDGEGSVETVLVSGSESDGLYEYESIIELTAVPEDGWGFDQWSGDISGSVNPITIEINVENDVVATFGQQGFTLSITSEGEGSVLIHPEKEEYYYGEEVELTAEPEEGWIFSHWEGDLSGDENPETILLEGSKTISAIFEAAPEIVVEVIELPIFEAYLDLELGEYGHYIEHAFARAINDHGEVVGDQLRATCRIMEDWCDIAWYDDLGFRWSQEKGLEFLPMDDISDRLPASDINNLREVVGFTHSGAVFVEFPVPDNIPITAIGGLLGGHPFDSDALAINDHSHVVGYATNSLDQQRAFIWDPESGMTDLGTLPGHRVSSATDINNSGQVVGWSHNTLFDRRYFLWDEKNGMTDLGTDPARSINDHGEMSSHVAINNHGQTVNEDGYLYDPKLGAIDLGTLPGGGGCQAFDLNNHGQIVGTCLNPKGWSRAVKWNVTIGFNGVYL